MKELFRNPHTFDMSNYYSGNVFVIGGRDFEREDKEEKQFVQKSETEKKKSIELDWSFLKNKKRRRF